MIDPDILKNITEIAIGAFGEQLGQAIVKELATGAVHACGPALVETGKAINHLKAVMVGKAGLYMPFVLPMRDISEIFDKMLYGDPSVGEITVSALLKILESAGEVKPPETHTVRGTLFPTALLSRGWWDEDRSSKLYEQIKWKSGYQKWGFTGFDQWGPSWDFTWGEENLKSGKYFIAQLAAGDEANSLPVILPESHAKQLREELYNRKQQWGGMEARITCTLAHREYFEKDLRSAGINIPSSDSLKYCLKIDEENKEHKIQYLSEKKYPTDYYSGYVWKCLVPKRQANDTGLRIEDVYYVWEHTDFTKKDAFDYGIEVLEKKQAIIERYLGEPLVPLYKSSLRVPGETWSKQPVQSLVIPKQYA